MGQETGGLDVAGKPWDACRGTPGRRGQELGMQDDGKNTSAAQPTMARRGVARQCSEKRSDAGRRRARSKFETSFDTTRFESNGH